MQISVSTNQITAPAAPANMGGGAGLVEDAENTGSVAFAPVDAVSISEAGRRASEQPIQSVQEIEREAADESDSGSPVAEDDAQDQVASGEKDRSEAQQDVSAERKEAQDKAEQRQQQADLAVIRQLKARDAEVKAHEAAHAAVGGQLAGSPSYSFQRGPDGVRYAVGGEVPIDVSKVPGDPQATLEKMQLVQRAALAPAEPSTQDRRVAALAAQQAAEARAELSSERRVGAGSAEDEQSSDSSLSFLAEQRKERAAEQKEEKAEKSRQETATSAEIFAEQNQRMRRINEFLLQITAPPAVSAGDLIDDLV